MFVRASTVTGIYQPLDTSVVTILHSVHRRTSAYDLVTRTETYNGRTQTGDHTNRLSTPSLRDEFSHLLSRFASSLEARLRVQWDLSFCCPHVGCSHNEVFHIYILYFASPILQALVRCKAGRKDVIRT